MERVSSSTLGMTLACARCHDHKFDPVSQKDYFRFLSLFTSAYNPTDWLPPKKRHLYHVSKTEQAEIEQKKKEANATLSKLQQQLKELRAPYRDRLREEKLNQIPRYHTALSQLFGGDIAGQTVKENSAHRGVNR